MENTSARRRPPSATAAPGSAFGSNPTSRKQSPAARISSSQRRRRMCSRRTWTSSCPYYEPSVRGHTVPHEPLRSRCLAPPAQEKSARSHERSWSYELWGRNEPVRRRRLRCATALAACFLAMAFLPRGGASFLSEEECANVTLLGTEADLASTPRADTSTEAVAVWIDGSVIASQDTYERLLADHEAIVELDGRDIAFRNAWYGRLWNGTTQVTFEGVAVLDEFREGTPPDFVCMNDHYDMSFVEENADKDVAKALLTSKKVLNWDVLELCYTALDGIDAFEPTSELDVLQTTNLVATREDPTTENVNVDYHYFLSEPAADMDPSACPEPCSGDIITYFWSSISGNVYELDKASSDADPSACWMTIFEKVEDGPPPGGVTTWDETRDCIDALLQGLEDQIRSSGVSSMDSAAGEASEAYHVGPGLIAAIVIPTVLVAFVAASIVFIRYQRRQRDKKMRTTDEAWGEGLDGDGKKKKPRPPTGKFRLTHAGAIGGSGAGVGGVGGTERGIPRASAPFPPPERACTDVGMDSDVEDVEDLEAGRGEGEPAVDDEQQENIGAGDMVYPMQI